MAGRNHLIGLDKPTAISIRGMSNPWPELRRQAVGHEMNRLESVAEILGLIGILTARRFLSGHENVSAQAAFFQFGQGVRADATQAAHCLPGHLYFNSIPLRDMADWAPESLRDRGPSISNRPGFLPKPMNQWLNHLSRFRNPHPNRKAAR